MSIAYQALVLFVYIFPGIVFGRAVSTAGRFRKPLALVDELVWGGLAAGVAHVIAISVFNSLIGPRVGLVVDLDCAFMHAMGNFGKDSAKLEKAIHAVSDHLWPVFGYFALTSVGCLLAGWIGQWLRTKNKIPAGLDWFGNEPSALRFREWSDVLITRKDDSLAIPLLATVVDFGKASFLYIGILESIQWGADGEPECFMLSDVIRRPFDWATDQLEASNDPKFFYDVLGTTFIIKASEAKTLNVLIRYLEMPSTETPPADSGGMAATPSPAC